MSNEGKQCERCGGLGRWHVGSIAVQNFKTCPACGGSGVVEAPATDGRGTVLLELADAYERLARRHPDVVTEHLPLIRAREALKRTVAPSEDGER